MYNSAPLELSPSAELFHYGVKGMRWGVRRSQTELDRAAGRKSAQKKSDVVGLDPRVAMVGAYATYALLKEYGRYKDSGQKHARKTRKTDFNKKPELAKKNMSVKEIERKIVKDINPNVGEKGTKNNCRRASLAYEMRRRGYDVKATKSKRGTGQDAASLHEAIGLKSAKSVWGETQITSPSLMRTATPEQKSQAVFNFLKDEPNGARGEVCFGWFFGGGHSMAFEVINNQPVIFDAQSGKTYRNPKSIQSFAGIMDDAAYTRLDNKTIDEDFIKRWVTNV